jgi:GDP-L-fucose synthase
MRAWIAGGSGLVGSAISRELGKSPNSYVVGTSSRELNLLDRSAVLKFVQELRPDVVVLAAAKVGGIQANIDFPVEFLTENLQIQCNVIDACHAADVEKFVFLGSSCIYPVDAEQPFKEESLFGGKLESTNEPYAIAKLAGVKLVQSYALEYGRRWFSVIPSNIYGPGDNFDNKSGHVLASLVRKFWEASQTGKSSVTLWGDGTPLREFTFADDLASGILFALENYEDTDPINIASGEETSILELANLVSKAASFSGEVLFDKSKPNGIRRKIQDSTKVRNLGWSPSVRLEVGVAKTYSWFEEATGQGLARL